MKWSQWSLWSGLAVLASGQSIPDLLDITIDDAISGFANSTFTSVQLTAAYLARIAEVNDILHAVIETNPDALSIAATADALRANGTVLGPLHGVPILIKDNIATNDSMVRAIRNNTAGSFSLLGAKVPRDSTLAYKLRQAGAVILGKANLSQWANFRSSNSSNGWSARGNQTFGAWHDLQDPSGSSSGSAVSSSIGLAMAALGSETDGSIISPSDVNGVVGIKPTVGLTSRALVIPISSHQDTVGPIARTVKDAAYLLSTIAGLDIADNYTLQIPNNGTIPDYVSACNGTTLNGTVIGIPRELFSEYVESYVNASFARAISVLQSIGATVLDNVTLPSYDDYAVSNNESIVLDADFKYDLPTSYFSQLTYNPNNITSLADLINFTVSYPAEDYPSRDIAVFLESQALNYSINSTYVQNAVAADYRIGGTDGILAALDAINGSVLMLPSEFASGIAAIAGYPIISIPLGYAPLNTTVQFNGRNSTIVAGPGIPYGLSFISRKFDEMTLVRIGYAFEQATMVRTKKRPLILPNVQISDITQDGLSFKKRSLYAKIIESSRV